MKKVELQWTTDSRAYKIFTTIDQDPYWDEGLKFHPRYRRGYKNTQKTLQMFKVREYRTWKYNRRTKYKLP